MKVCKKCGHTAFHANQVCRQNIVVDGKSNFLEATDTYDAEAPHGPFACGECNAEADTLEELVEDRPETTLKKYRIHATIDVYYTEVEAKDAETAQRYILAKLESSKDGIEHATSGSVEFEVNEAEEE
jgi:hypothetical protein